MGKPLKYFLISVAFIGLLLVAAVVAVTTFFDVESYKPEIEQLITEKTGLPVTFGGEVSLSLFPWVGLRLTDLQLDNPEGYQAKTFARIAAFEARVKVMPLLSKQVEIDKIVLNRPEIYLESDKNGTWNVQKMSSTGKPEEPKTTTADKKAQPTGADNITAGGFGLESLVVGQCAITDGLVQINDLKSKQKHEITDFNLELADVSFDKAISLTIKALVDGKPLGLEGSIGPLGQDPLSSKINLDLVITALDTLTVKAVGSLADLKQQQNFQMTVAVEPFSPRKLFAGLGEPFPVTTSDPKALDNVGLQFKVTGNASKVVLSDANMILDQTNLKLDLTAKDFSRPDIAFKADLDSIDLDRYLPPAGTDEQGGEGQGAATKGAVKKQVAIDYKPLRKLVLKGVASLGTVKISGGTVTNIVLDVEGRKGVFTLKSLGMDLYQGSITGTGSLNVLKNTPVTRVKFAMKDVQIGPLLKDFAKKDVIEGRVKADIALNLRGDNGDQIKKSLNGKGDFLFEDGALIGLDLAKMARNIKTGFTLQQQGERPKTDFAELHAPFSITNGLVDTEKTTLVSPFLRVIVSGSANLVSEALNMKVKPTLVGTIKGQGDTEKRDGLTVPVLVSGTFQTPKFQPDLESMIKDKIPTEKMLGEVIKTGKLPVENKEQLKKEVDQAKGLLKGLLGQ